MRLGRSNDRLPVPATKIGCPTSRSFFAMWDTTVPDVRLCRLSLGAKPSDLRFRIPLLEARNTILKQNCHLACPGVPWDWGEIVERSAVFFYFSRRFLSPHESVLDSSRSNSSNLILFGRTLIKAINKLPRQNANCSANLDTRG